MLVGIGWLEIMYVAFYNMKGDKQMNAFILQEPLLV